MAQGSNGLHTSLTPDLQEQQRKEQQKKVEAIQEIKAQQEHLAKKLAELEGGPITTEDSEHDIPHMLKQALAQGQHQKSSQELLIQQLRSALGGNKDDDPNRTLLKALLTQQNKTVAEGGTNTLKPDLFNKLMQAEPNNMAEWLANLNRCEEG